MNHPDQKQRPLWRTVILVGFLVWLADSFVDGMLTGRSLIEVVFPAINEPILWLRLALVLLVIAGGSMAFSFRRRSFTSAESNETLPAWLQQTMSTLPIAVAVLDRTMCYLYANRQWLRQFDLDENTLVGQFHGDVFPHMEQDWWDTCQQSLTEDRQQHITTDFTTNNGTVKQLQWDIQPWYDETHMVGGLLLYVTESVDAQPTESPHNTYYQMLMDYATDAIFVSDSAGHYVDVNPRACELLGYTRDELLNMSAAKTVAPESIAQQPLRLAELQEGRPILSERSFIRKDGTRVSVETNSRLLPDGHLMSIVRDISERRESEAHRLEKERLMTALEQQRELSALKTNFMTRVSHEFRTPLAIIGVSGFLLNKHFDTMSEDKRTEHLGKINTHIDELGRMLDDVMMVLRAEDHSLVFNPETVDVVAVCEDVLETLRVTYRTQRPVTFTYGEDLNRVMVDQHLIQHVLVNLLTNAIKFSPDGQPVTLDVRRDGNWVIFTVQDEGIGIPEDSLDKIYDAYYRAPNVDDISGSGLGLRIVRDCVNRHNGQIDVDSTLGSGSTFTITLPIVDTTESAPD